MLPLINWLMLPQQGLKTRTRTCLYESVAILRRRASTSGDTEHSLKILTCVVPGSGIHSPYATYGSFHSYPVPRI
ncbi:MAG: hypothetical protein JWL82_528 [Parcubacteria group bacterium]|nr:hypothetical protein [Parcubacteria group bacterium]